MGFKARTKPGWDEDLAGRIRHAFGPRTDLVEKKMFGGLAFMVRGHMCVGLTKADMLVRVGPDAWEDALSQPHARPMDFTGKPMRGMVYVGKGATGRRASLSKWIQRGLSFVNTLPAK